MKCSSVLIASFIMSYSVYAGTELLAPIDNATATIRYTLNSYNIDTVTLNGKQYSRVTSPELPAYTLEKGFPELPYSSEAVRLYKDGDVQLKVESVKYREISALPVVPSKGKISRAIIPDSVNVEMGSIYSENRFWPELPVELGNPYLIRGTRGISAKIKPISYNPKTGKIRIAEEIQFSIIENGSTPRSSSVGSSSQEFNRGHDRFINGTSPTMLRYVPRGDGDKMAIITTTKYKSAADEFSFWKNRKGLVSTVYTYPENTGGEGYESLRTFVQYLYDTQGITYVTIIGDWEDVPSKGEDYGFDLGDGDVSSDPYYAFLSGTDLYPDIFVGRISVETAASADEVVKKIVNYEMFPDVGGEWYQKAVSVGTSEAEAVFTDYQILSDSVNVNLQKYGYTTIDTIYQGFGESIDNFSAYLNEGRGLVNFMGHGYFDGFGFNSPFWYNISNVQRLSNGTKLPIVIPLACKIGAFKGRTVVCEEWLRKSDGGAVAIMGSSPDMDWTQPQYAAVEMNRLISNDAYNSLGAYFYNGEMRMLDVCNPGDADKTVKTWNYFGDPSLQLITKSPVALDLAVSGTAGIGNNTLNISGPAGTLVTLYSPELAIQSSTTITGSSVDISFIAPSQGKVYITGTARNTAPYLDSIEIGAIRVASANSMSLKAMSARINDRNDLVVGVPTAGTYSVEVFGLNGRKLLGQSTKLTSGFTVVPLNGLNGAGPVIMKIHGSSGSIVSKAILK